MSTSLKNALRRQGERKIVWLTAAALLMAAGLSANAGNWLSNRRAVVNSLPVPAVVQQNATPIRERAVIRLLTSGFNPTEVTGAAGHYRIVATRRSRTEEVKLQLKLEGGELVEELLMPEDEVNWTTLIELQSGSYQLNVVNHPEWVCHIDVQ